MTLLELTAPLYMAYWTILAPYDVTCEDVAELILFEEDEDNCNAAVSILVELTPLYLNCLSWS